MPTVNLSWTDNSGVENGFRVYRTTTSNPSFPTDYSKITTTGENTTTYTDSNAPGDTVYYAVTAYNGSGESSETKTSIYTITAPEITGSLSASSSGDDITLSLPSVDWNGDQGSYLLYKGQSSGSLTQFDSVGSSTSSYTDSALEDGEKYYYAVRATNTEGDSNLSNEVSQTTSLPTATNVSGSLNNGDIDISWSNNDDSSDGGIDIERSTDSGSSWSTVASGLSASTTSYTDTSTSSGTSYRYRIERNTDHTSSTSSSTSDIQTVSAPSTPQNVSTSVSGDDITVSWDSVNWNGDTGHYDVYRGQSSGSHSQLSQVASGTTSYTDSGLEDGEQYFYVVDATNSAGSSSTSNEASGTTTLPSASSVSGSSNSNGSITVSWSNNDDSSDGDIDVEKSGDSGSSWSTVASGLSTSTTSYTDSSTTSGQSYRYRIERNTDHRTATSGSTGDITSSSPPSTPQNLSSSVTGDDITISWDSVDWNGDTGHYDVYRGQSSGSHSQLTQVSSGTTSYTDSALEDGEQFFYAVEATNSAGTSSTSSEVSQTTTLPSPTIGSATDNANDNVDVSWTNNDDSSDGVIDVERSSDGGSTWSATTTGLSPSTSSYTDTSVSDGITYQYRIERSTDHLTVTSGTTSVDTTDAPVLTGSLSSSVSADDITLSLPSVDWGGEQDSYLLYKGQSSGSLSQFDSVSASTSSYTDSALEDGEQYFYAVEATNSVGTSSTSSEVSETTALPAPTLDGLNAGTRREITISYTVTDDSSDGDLVIERSTDGGSSWSAVTTVSDLTLTSYTNTGLLDGEQYTYRLSRRTDHSTTQSSTSSATTLPPAINSVSTSYVADDQIDVTINGSINNGNYHVQISRDGSGYVNPTGGNTTPNSTGTFSYGPNSDYSYDSQVGIDSEFTFRVRSETPHTQSSWSETETVYTSPVPPHNPSVDRPQGNEIDISWTQSSDIDRAVEVQFREDTGSGYSKWQPQVEYEWYDTQTYYNNNSHPSTTSEFDNFFDTSNSGVSVGGSGRWKQEIIWGTRGEPRPSFLPGDGFSFKATGRFYAPSSGTYQFGLDGDDAVDIFVDDTLVASWYSGHGTAGDFSHNGSISLDKGWHTFTARHEEGGGGEALAVGWQKPSDSSWIHFDPFTTSSYTESLPDDVRRQYRLQTLGETGIASEWTYSDYGNDGNVYFEDDFESGDASNWDSFRSGNGGQSSATVVQSPNSYDLNISGADSGDYFFEVDDGEAITKQLGDLSGETDVIVKCAMASGSLDSSGEVNLIEWYDGSGWQTLHEQRWEYNEQGWVEVTTRVPDSYLSTDSRLRIGQWTSGYGADAGAFDHVVVSDIVHEYTKPASPSNPQTTANNHRELDLSWTANSTFASTEVFTRVAGSGNSFEKRFWDDPHTWTGLLDGEKYEWYPSEVQGQTRHGDYTNWWRTNGPTVTATTLPPEITGTSASYVADDQIDVTVNGAINNGTYHVQISRDGSGYTDPSGGNTTPTATGTYSYGPNSDNSYNSQVGIDSSFTFRVRSETSHTSSSWNATGTVYTTPVPPHNPSVSRPGANTVSISFVNQSNIQNGTEVQYREDTGTGYGSWTSVTTTTSTATSVSFDTANQTWMQEDARYQFRIRHIRGGKTSSWSYTDYGNNGNVYFSDDFESGDLTAWDSTNLVDDWGVHDSAFVDSHASSDDQSSNNRVHPVTGPDEGTYYLFGDGSGYVQKNLGDLSAESNVVVKCGMAAGSMDGSGEAGGIQWYDGSSWNNLEQFSHEYNRQEWVEVTALIPSSWLSTDNRLRLNGYGVSGDYMAWDRVVVSDILHEYTTPAIPTGLRLDNGTEGEISASWTPESTFGSDRAYARLDGSRVEKNYPGTSGSTTFTNLKDGEEYSIEVETWIYQYRNGADTGNRWLSNRITNLGITRHPAPTGASIANITPSSADLSWTDNSNNEDTQRVYLDEAGTPTGMRYSGLGVQEEVTVGSVPHDGTPTFSVAVRFSYKTLDTGSSNNEWRGVVGANGQGNFLLIEENGEATFRVPSSNTGFLRSINSISLNESPDTAVTTYDGSTKYCYVNNGPGNSESVSNSSIDLQGFFIGNDDTSHNPDGVIYEVALYDRVLTASERTDWENGDVPAAPIGYWPLDHNYNGVTRDLSEFANDGTVNGPSLSSDKSALTFNTSNSYADTPDLGNTGAFSISAEFKKTNTGTNYLADGRLGSDNWWFLTNYNSYDINFYGRATWNGLSDEVWTYVTATADSNSSELFVDGSSKDTGSGVTGTLDAVRFGLRYSNSGALNGEIRNVQIHNRKLSASEAKRVAQGEIIIDGLLAYYPMSEIQNGVTPDLYNGNDANVGGDTTEYGNGPKLKALTSSNTTLASLNSLINGTTYETYVHTETEHSITRDN